MMRRSHQFLSSPIGTVTSSHCCAVRCPALAQPLIRMDKKGEHLCSPPRPHTTVLTRLHVFKPQRRKIHVFQELLLPCHFPALHPSKRTLFSLGKQMNPSSFLNKPQKKLEINHAAKPEIGQVNVQNWAPTIPFTDIVAFSTLKITSLSVFRNITWSAFSHKTYLMVYIFILWEVSKAIHLRLSNIFFRKTLFDSSFANWTVQTTVFQHALLCLQCVCQIFHLVLIQTGEGRGDISCSHPLSSGTSNVPSAQSHGKYGKTTKRQEVGNHKWNGRGINLPMEGREVCGGII